MVVRTRVPREEVREMTNDPAKRKAAITWAAMLASIATVITAIANLIRALRG